MPSNETGSRGASTHGRNVSDEVNTYVLRVRRLSKTFPGQVALDRVSLDVLKGEIHALLGENGSGKSTFIKCLAGVYQPDEDSEILVGGTQLPKSYPSSTAHRFGLAFVHQDLGLVPSLSVLENLALGRGFHTKAFWRIDWRSERLRASQMLAEFGLHISPDALVKDLSMVNRTLLAITRALQSLQDTHEHGRLLVLDEPTAALPDADTHHLFDVLRQVVTRGVGIIYVSHRLEEIFQIATRVSVLRNGHLVGTFTTDSLNENELIHHIAGHSVESTIVKHIPSSDVRREKETKGVLRVEHLSGKRVQDISFSLAEKEILGIAGLAGSGRSELARLLFGAQLKTSGRIFLHGQELFLKHPADAIRKGIAFVPQDRRRDGCVLPMSAGANMTLPSLHSFARWGHINSKAEQGVINTLVENFHVRPRQSSRPIAQFSGGNQQKVILAKWMYRKPGVLILDEPVQGIDIGAKAEVYALLEQAVEIGMSAIIVDSEFENLARLCHRVLILRNGRLVEELTGVMLTRDRIVEQVFTRVTPSTDDTFGPDLSASASEATTKEE